MLETEIFGVCPALQQGGYIVLFQHVAQTKCMLPSTELWWHEHAHRIFISWYKLWTPFLYVPILCLQYREPFLQSVLPTKVMCNFYCFKTFLKSSSGCTTKVEWYSQTKLLKFMLSACCKMRVIKEKRGWQKVSYAEFFRLSYHGILNFTTDCHIYMPLVSSTCFYLLLLLPCVAKDRGRRQVVDSVGTKQECGIKPVRQNQQPEGV